jgi:hypothetical protein
MPAWAKMPPHPRRRRRPCPEWLRSGHELARLAEFYDAVRRRIAPLFGRHWAPLPRTRALRLLGPPTRG